QGFLARLARTATDFKPALTFRRRLPDSVDAKRDGTIPIANLARFHALANGITISATLDRLVAAEEVGALAAETAQSLREAFALATRLRLDHRAEQSRNRRALDNVIDGQALPPRARSELQEAFRGGVDAQKQLGRYVPMGL